MTFSGPKNTIFNVEQRRPFRRQPTDFQVAQSLGFKATFALGRLMSKTMGAALLNSSICLGSEFSQDVVERPHCASLH